MNPQRERAQLLMLTLFTYLMVIGMGMLLVDCKPKAKPATTPPITQGQIDSIRCALESNAQRSETDRKDAQKKSDSTKTDYTQAQKRYESIQVKLP